MTAAPAFLVFDGLDGTGKSTQLARLAAWLRERGVPVTTCADPGGTDLGEKVRELLLFGRATRMGPRAEALLFMASRAELVEQVIRPAVARGDVVLSDRFVLANVVYQAHAGGLDPADLWAVGAFSTGGIAPNLTLLLDMPPAAARARRGRPADRIEGRGDEFDAKVGDGFRLEARRRPDAMRVIDADRPADAVFADVLIAAVPVLRASGHPV